MDEVVVASEFEGGRGGGCCHGCGGRVDFCDGERGHRRLGWGAIGISVVFVVRVYRGVLLKGFLIFFFGEDLPADGKRKCLQRYKSFSRVHIISRLHEQCGLTRTRVYLHFRFRVMDTENSITFKRQGKDESKQVIEFHKQKKARSELWSQSARPDWVSGIM